MRKRFFGLKLSPLPLAQWASMNDNDTGNRPPNGTEQAAALFTERELYLHRRQSTKVSARGSFPRVGVKDGNRRLACCQTVFAFDPEATTFSPTMATYWPAKRERSARIKKSNSLLEAFLRRRLAIRCLLRKGTLTGHSWFVNLNPRTTQGNPRGYRYTLNCETIS